MRPRRRGGVERDARRRPAKEIRLPLGQDHHVGRLHESGRGQLQPLPFVQAEKLHEQQAKLPAEASSPAETLAHSETRAQLRRCIESLPPKHQEIIRLRFFEEASLPDMAALLGCSIGTVKSRLHHALEKLRKMKMNLLDLKGDTQI